MARYHLIIANLPSDIWWRVRTNDPPLAPISSLVGWSVLHPFAYSKLNFFAHAEALSPISSVGDDFIFFTKHLVLIAPELPGAEPNDVAILNEISRFLPNLRYLSWQPQLARIAMASARLSSDEFPQIGQPRWGKPIEMMTRSSLIEGAATWESVVKAASLHQDFEIPVHATILLDALEAQVENNYRTAILYSAIAMESLARTILAASYERQKEDALKSQSTQSRFVRFQTPDGEIMKDPIAMLLLDRDSFSSLLHEAPLYLLRRSLLVDKEDLYKDALRLYKTRNKIVHLGECKEDAEYIRLDQNGVRQAVLTAFSVFEWFGESVGGIANAIRQNSTFQKCRASFLEY